MSDSGGNGFAGYRVIYPVDVRRQARRLTDGLGLDDRRRVAAALRVIHARLRNDPLVFGEHRFSQEGVAHTVRVVGVAPLIVRFAVYEDLRTVWVLGLHLLTH
jgi:hypothetical protein